MAYGRTRNTTCDWWNNWIWKKDHFACSKLLVCVTISYDWISPYVITYCNSWFQNKRNCHTCFNCVLVCHETGHVARLPAIRELTVWQFVQSVTNRSPRFTSDNCIVTSNSSSENYSMNWYGSRWNRRDTIQLTCFYILNRTILLAIRYDFSNAWVFAFTKQSIWNI